MKFAHRSAWLNLCLLLFVNLLSAAPAPENSTPPPEKANAETNTLAPQETVAENHPLLNLVLLDRDEALKQAATVTTEKYPDADEVLVASAIRVDYRADGTYTQLDETYLKILTEKGRSENLVINSHFTLPYQLIEDCQIPLLEIIKPDGTTIPIDVAAQSTLTINHTSMENNIYNPNDKIISVNITGLAVGDVLHFRLYDNVRQPRAAGFFVDFFSLEQTRPLLRQTIEINGLREKPLKQIILRDEVAGTVQYTTQTLPNGNPQYRWEISNVPQIFPEPKTPPLYLCTQRLMVSTAENWEEISRWYANLCKPALATVTPALKAEVAKIIGDETDPLKKINLLFTWVSQQIRYMGVMNEATSPGYEPHAVADTFANRHGVCRDKAALLAAMLEIAGIEAHPVLINVKGKKDPEAVNTFFDHAITAARVGENTPWILMDPTNENARELLPAYLSDKSYLVANERGETLHTSPIIPAAENMLAINTVGTLSDTGDLTAETTIDFNGINDTIYRGFFSSVTPSERRRFLESIIRGLYADATLTAWSIQPENPQNTAQPLTAKLHFSARNIFISKQNLAMLPLPFLGARLGAANFLLGRADLEKRHFPLQLASTCGVNETVKIDLPAALASEISMPVYKPIVNDEITWKRSLARVGKALLGRNEFVINTVEFSPQQYLTLKEELKTIEYDSRKMPMFALKKLGAASKVTGNHVAADSIILLDETTLEYLDETAWRERQTVRKKILTYAGIKKYGEVVIDFYPAYENVKIESATVTAPNGKIQTISAHEINVMDQAWNATAPRYVGGKTLVASLPGVEIGSVIEYRILREINAQPFFHARQAFAEFEPIVRKTVTLKAEDYTKIRTLSTLHLDFEDAVDGGKTWAINNEPLIKPEDNLPPRYSFTPAVFLSSSPSWGQYAQYAREKILAAANSEQLKEKRQELLGNEKLTLAKLRSVVDTVAQTVRVAGASFNHLPLTHLTPAAQTWRDGYGNTTDCAALWWALLNDENAELFLVTEIPAAYNLPLPQLELPTPTIFSHVLIRLKVENRTVWLNDITQYDELGTTPSNGKLALNLQTGNLEAIRTDAAFDDNDEVNYSIELSEDGTALIRETTIVTGENYGVAKKLFAQMTPEQRRRHQQNELTALSQSAEAVGEYVTNFAAYPGKTEFTARVPKYAVADGNFLYLQLPQTLVFKLRSTERENPLFFATPKRARINTDLILPPRWLPLIFPSKYRWQSPIDGEGKIEIEALYGIGVATGKKNILRINQYINLQPAYYVPALYPELLKVQSQLAHDSARTIMLADKEWLDLQKLKTPEKE